MRVLLATAPWTFAELYPGEMAGRFSVPSASPPLGILYLSACLKAEGHDVAFFDGMDRTNEDFHAVVRSFDPGLVGLHCTTFSWPRTAALVIEHAARGGAPTVLGGPHATGATAAPLLDCPALDYILAGDADFAICRLVDALEGRVPIEEVPGLGTLDATGAVHFAGVEYVRDLDALPMPDYDLIDIRDYPPSIAFYDRLPSMTMMTTRGCPSQCTFCDAPSNYRERSIEKVIEEIRFLKRRFGVRHILFYDEDMALNRKRTLRLCAALQEADLDVSWCCNARADKVTPDLLATMKAAGCWRILLGIESGSQRILDEVCKGVTLDMIRQQVRVVRDAGIEVMGTFVFGFPGETIEDGRATIDFAIELGLDYAIFLKLTPFPGTAIADGIEEHGTVTGRWGPQLISFIPNSMTEAELAELSSEAMRRFYMRPGYLVRRALKMRTVHDVTRNLRGFLSLRGIRARHFLRA